MAKPKIKSDGRTITVRVPISIRMRGGRKVVLVPDGSPGGGIQFSQRIDNAIVKAIARAFRWRKMLEDGTHTTISEIAEAEKINEAYVGRVLRLANLAPSLVQAIVDGHQPAEISLATLLRPFPAAWADQVKRWP